MFSLLKYQRDWLSDNNRFKIELKSRQIGGSVALCFDAVENALSEKCKNLILSTTERQSKEVIDKIYSIFHVFNRVIKFKLPIENKSEIELPNGSRIISLPASPKSVRGYSGHIYLDEFAFHRDAKEIWKSMLPIATRGYKVNIISTPAGKSGKFYEIWQNAEDMGFSRHKVNIYRAISDGFKVNLDEIKRATDPESFAQEYECVFVDENYAYFTYDEIIQIVEDVDYGSEQNAWNGHKLGQFYMGIDIGRRKDLTAFIVAEKINDIFYIRHIENMRNSSFEAQRLRIEELKCIYNPIRICIDEGGLGMQLAEELRLKFSSTVEPIMFSNKVKEEMATNIKKLIDKKNLRIPHHKLLMKHMHAIKKVITTAGNIRYDAESTDEGHGDLFWALALACHAGHSGTGMLSNITTRKRREICELTKGY